MSESTTEALTSLIESRRSVRRFTEETVPDQVLEECLRLATLAPNACNLQTWEFHVIRDEALRQRIAKAAMNQNAARSSPVMVAVVARIDTWRAHAKMLLEEMPDEDRKPIVERFYSRTVPVQYAVGPLGIFGPAKRLLIAVTRLFRPVPWTPVSVSELQMWSVKSASLAAANLMLALKSHGYDSCPMEGFDEGRVRRLLGLPRTARVPMLIAAGKPAPRAIYNQRLRFDLSINVRWK